MASRRAEQHRRYDLDGSHYDDDGSGEDTTVVETDGSKIGCPATGCNGYELMRDLDFAVATDYVSGAINSAWHSPGSGWLPIAHDTDPGTASFQGSGFATILDGNGNSIANLYINRTDEDFVGLIGSTAAGSAVRNLTLTAVSVTGGSLVGGLIGETVQDTRISFVAVSGDVTGMNRQYWRIDWKHRRFYSWRHHHRQLQQRHCVG